MSRQQTTHEIHENLAIGAGVFLGSESELRRSTAQEPMAVIPVPEWIEDGGLGFYSGTALRRPDRIGERRRGCSTAFADRRHRAFQHSSATAGLRSQTG